MLYIYYIIQRKKNTRKKKYKNPAYSSCAFFFALSITL